MASGWSNNDHVSLGLWSPLGPPQSWQQLWSVPDGVFAESCPKWLCLVLPVGCDGGDSGPPLGTQLLPASGAHCWGNSCRDAPGGQWG